MPKSRQVKKDRNAPTPAAIRTPVKIGGRKSSKSALRMSTEELLEALNSSNTRGRDKGKIRNVLHGRGITDFELTQEDAA